MTIYQVDKILSACATWYLIFVTSANYSSVRFLAVFLFWGLYITFLKTFFLFWICLSSFEFTVSKQATCAPVRKEPTENKLHGTNHIQPLWFRKIQEYVKYLSRVEILNSLLAAEKQQVASALMEKHFSKNDVIIQQGASAGANQKTGGQWPRLFRCWVTVTHYALPWDSFPGRVGYGWTWWAATWESPDSCEGWTHSVLAECPEMWCKMLFW